jgi:hypothetical protein
VIPAIGARIRGGSIETGPKRSMDRRFYDARGPPGRECNPGPSVDKIPNAKEG